MRLIKEFKNVLPESERRKKTQSNLQDRKWLETKVLPELEGTILFVGINYYTDFYHNLVKPGSTFITVDPDESVAKYGSPHGHSVTTVQEFLLANSSKCIDCCVLYGLFGMNHSFIDIRTPEGQNDAINLIYLSIMATTKQIIYASSTDVVTIDKLRAIYFDAKNKVIDSNNFKTFENLIIKPSANHSNMLGIWEKVI